MQSQIRKIISTVLVVPFLLLSVIPVSYAQGLMQLPEPGSMVGLTAAFVPAHLIGVSVDTQNPFQFEFLIHKGEEPLSDIEKHNEYQALIKYFLAALTVPNIDQWVNLSPYEQTRMIQDNFGSTDMGRDLLAQDYLLKQLTASLMHPDSDLGRNFWNRIYEKAYQEHGTADIEVDAFNKVWILPATAEVFEKDNTALISNSYLRVMTENDYLAMESNALTRSMGEEAEISQSAPISSSIVKEIIIPEIEREVNQGKTFANLRQIYGAMILATWFKQQLRETILGKAYADHSTVNGIEQDPKNNEAVYQQYLQAFQVGVVNMIKEEVDQSTQEIIPRKYFSGGAWGLQKPVGVTTEPAQKPNIPSDYAEAVVVDLTTPNQQAAAFIDAAALTGEKTDDQKRAKHLIDAQFIPQIVYFLKTTNIIRTTGQDLVSLMQESLENSPYAPFFNDLNRVSQELVKYIQFIPNQWMFTYSNDLNETLKREISVERVIQAVNSGELHRDVFSSHIPYAIHHYFKNPAFRSVMDRTENEIREHSRDFLKKKWFGPSLDKHNPQIIEQIADAMVASLQKTEQSDGTWKYSLDSQKVTPSYWREPIEAIFPSPVLGDSQKVEKPVNTGGIDFNEQYLQMNIKHDGNGVVLPTHQQDFENIRIDGLTPYILTIQPVTASPVFYQLTQ